MHLVGRGKARPSVCLASGEKQDSESQESERQLIALPLASLFLSLRCAVMFPPLDLKCCPELINPHGTHKLVLLAQQSKRGENGSARVPALVPDFLSFFLSGNDNMAQHTHIHTYLC